MAISLTCLFTKANSTTTRELLSLWSIQKVAARMAAMLLSWRRHPRIRLAGSFTVSFMQTMCLGKARYLDVAIRMRRFEYRGLLAHNL